MLYLSVCTSIFLTLFDTLLSLPPPSLPPSFPLSLPPSSLLASLSFFLRTIEAESLAAFDKMIATLATWCEEHGAGAQEMPKVTEIIAVKQEGSWMRAEVSRQVSDR